MGHPLDAKPDEDAVSDFVQEEDAMEIKDRHGDWLDSRQIKPKSVDKQPKFKSRRTYIKTAAYLKSLGLKQDNMDDQSE